jgi:hypothetical protein
MGTSGLERISTVSNLTFRPPRQNGRGGPKPASPCCAMFGFDCYQVLLVQPPFEPVQVREVVPSEAFVMVKVLPDFECATTL